nr:uncharacterized protein LOC108133664 [Drosophila bipectinata]
MSENGWDPHKTMLTSCRIKKEQSGAKGVGGIAQVLATCCLRKLGNNRRANRVKCRKWLKPRKRAAKRCNFVLLSEQAVCGGNKKTVSFDPKKIGQDIETGGEIYDIKKGL